MITRAKSHQIKIGLLIALTFCFVTVVRASKTLADYRSRLHQAIQLLDSMDEKQFAAKGRSQLTALLPPQETIVNDENKTVEIDNRWIDEEIKKLDDTKKQVDKDKIYDNILDRIKLISGDADKVANASSSADGQGFDKN